MMKMMMMYVSDMKGRSLLVQCMEKVTLLVPSRDVRCRLPVVVHNPMMWVLQIHHDERPDLYQSLEAESWIFDDPHH